MGLASKGGGVTTGVGSGVRLGLAVGSGGADEEEPMQTAASTTTPVITVARAARKIRRSSRKKPSVSEGILMLRTCLMRRELLLWCFSTKTPPQS